MVPIFISPEAFTTGDAKYFGHWHLWLFSKIGFQQLSRGISGMEPEVTATGSARSCGGFHHTTGSQSKRNSEE